MVFFICICLAVLALPTLLWIKGTKTFTKLGAILLLALLAWGSYKLLEMGTLPPDARMSNGNPIVVLLPLAFLSSVAYGCVLMAAAGKARLTGKSMRMAAGGAFLALLLLDVLLIQRTMGGYRLTMESLGGSPDTAASVLYGMPWLNAYTYKIAFRTETFLLLTFVSVQLGYLYRILRSRLKS